MYLTVLRSASELDYSLACWSPLPLELLTVCGSESRLESRLVNRLALLMVS